MSREHLFFIVSGGHGGSRGRILGVFTLGIYTDAIFVRHTKTALKLIDATPHLIVTSATLFSLKRNSIKMLAYIEVIEHVLKASFILSE